MNGFTLNGFTRVGQNIRGTCSACRRAVNMYAVGWLNDCPKDCPLEVFLIRVNAGSILTHLTQGAPK
jgi:hypothetical protein